MSTQPIDEPIVIPDRDRDKSYIGTYSEVISQVKMTTSDGSTVVIDLENLGQIEVQPWSSEEHDAPDAIIGTYEDRTVFNPCNLHDVQILQLMAEHATKFRQIIDAEHEAEDKKQAAMMKVNGSGKKPAQPSLLTSGEDENVFVTKEEIREAVAVMSR